MAGLSIELGNLTAYEYTLSDILHEYDSWNDDVSRSYERYVDLIGQIISSLDFVLKEIEGAINNINHIDVNKQKSELSEYSSRLRRL